MNVNWTRTQERSEIRVAYIYIEKPPGAHKFFLGLNMYQKVFGAVKHSTDTKTREDVDICRGYQTEFYAERLSILC